MKAALIVPDHALAELRPRPARRRLAENVVCMYGEEKERVINIRWRGRFPANVVRMATRAWMKIGTVAEMHGGCLPENVGKLVRVLTNVPNENGCIKVEAMFGNLLSTYNIDTGERTGLEKSANAEFKNLRRVWRDRK